MDNNSDINNQGQLLPLEFQKGGFSDPTNSTLQEFLNKLEETYNGNETKKVIKDIVSLYISSKENKCLQDEARDVIIELFTKYNGKRQLKKYLQDLVIKQNLVHEIIKATAQDLLETIKKDKSCNLIKCYEFLHFVAILQASPSYDFDKNIRPLFPLYITLFDSFAIYASQVKQDVIPEIEDLNTVMNSVLKQILTVFVQNSSFLNEVKDKYLQQFLMYSYILLFNEKIGFDLRMKVCLVFVYSFHVIEGDNMSVSQLISKSSSPFNLSVNPQEGKDTPSDYFIIIYSAILSVLPEDKLLSEKVDGKSLLYVLFEGILETTKSDHGHSSIIVETSRTLCMIAKHLKNIPIDLIKPLFLEGLFYVSFHLYHFVDTVRNYSKIFFEELVVLAAHHHKNGFTDLTNLMIEKIEEVPEECIMRFFAYEHIAKFYGCDFLLKKFEHLPLVLLEYIGNSTVTEQVCKTYQVLLEKSFNYTSLDNESQWAKTWISPAINVLKSGQENEHFCQKIIITAFRLQPAILRMIFPNDYVGTTEESKVLLHCLHNARKNGIELSLEKDGNLYWRGLIDKQKMDMFMIHQHEEIRILVLASVAESLKSTEYFLDWEFIFLLSYIRYNITTQSPNVRQQIVSYYKKVLARYDAGYKVILRNIATLNKLIEAKYSENDQMRYLAVYHELKRSYMRFICSLTRILIGNLSYDSNYPRRATSLELLLVIHGVLPPEDWVRYWNEEDVKNSHNILFDTYENNKKMIVKLLKTLPPQYLGFVNVNFTNTYMNRSFELALDVKPSKTLSAAYLFEICPYSPFFCDAVNGECGQDKKKIKDPTLGMIVELIRKFLNQSSEIKIDHINMAKSSVYGLILAIRHLLENRNIDQYNDTYAGVFDHLVTTSFSISDKIMPVVCNPSPEGYLPFNPEDICETDESPKSQMVLVYAWRTMKEMTLLLSEIVKQSIKLEKQTTMLPEDVLRKVGEFFVNVFIQSKHRGVFEQAYVGFSIICDAFWKSVRPNLYILPKKWLQDAVDLCTGKKHSEELCATRRSAGLPFLVLSVLTTEPDASYFHNAMEQLLGCAEGNDNCTVETKMHCLNVLRAVFRHSKLGELVAGYVARGVILALGGFKSEDWGVRNSATLLFASLMTRMFGVQRTSDADQLCLKNKLTVKLFFLRYQQLYKFILNCLGKECQDSSSLVLQPILMILSRLYPSTFDDGPNQASEYLPYINVCLSNPDYRTREAAAKASLALINVREVKEHFDRCFSKISENKIGDNEYHGILLQLYHILKSTSVKDLPLTIYLKKSSHIWDNVDKKFSHMTVNLYTELVTLFLYICRDFDDLSWLKRILLYLSKQKRHTIHVTWQGKFDLSRTILAYFIAINKFEETDATYATLTNEIMSYLYGPKSKMKKYSLELLIALNQRHVYYNRIDHVTINLDANFERHPMFYTGDVELNPEISELVNYFCRTSIEKILKHIHPYLKSFLMEELKLMQYISDEDRVLLFLLLNFYPCAIKFLRLSKQETLNVLINYCDCDNEELISSVITCISTFLGEVDHNLLKYDRLLELLAKSASPAASPHRRLTVCDFLCKNCALYCNEEPVLKGDQLCTVLNIVMVLLEDEDLNVRNAMSNYESAFKVRIKINNFTNQTISGHRWPVVPEKAKEDLIHLMTVLLPQEKAVCLIFSWACRYFPDPSTESLEVFERGGLNQYAENTPLIDICSRVLIKMLWALPEGLSYEDKSIFPEEQTQIVTTILLNSLMKYNSPMMLKKTKMSVICVLKSVYVFLENAEISSEFAVNFRTYLNDTILSYLTTHLEHGDLFCVKKIIRKLYNPVFRLNNN